LSLDRETIVREAERQIAVHGLPRVSLRHLAEAFSVTKAALYHHFPDGKMEILEAVLAREEEALGEAMESARIGSEDPCLQVQAVAEAILDHRRVKPPWTETGVPAVDRILGRHVQRRRQRQREVLLRIARQGIEQGIFRSTDPPRLAVFFQLVLERMVEPLAVEMNPAQARERVRLWLDFFFHGIVFAQARGVRSGD
jgi:AcrR family transcriptional regulator